MRARVSLERRAGIVVVVDDVGDGDGDGASAREVDDERGRGTRRAGAGGSRVFFSGALG